MCLGGSSASNAAGNPIVELVALIGHHHDRSGRVLLGGLLGDRLVEIGIERLAFRLDRLAVVLGQDVFQLLGHQTKAFQ